MNTQGNSSGRNPRSAIAFFLSLLICTAWTWLLNRPIPMGDKTIPAPGTFFNPFRGFWQNAEPRDGGWKSASFSGLTRDSVSVVFDDRMVPHIFAQNTEDAAFVQGYVIARFRLFQLDIATRAVAGRLSEIIGPRTLERDRLQRHKGLKETARIIAGAWRRQPEIGPILEAFTRGINTRLQELKPRDYPIEFKLLGYEPEPWSVEKTALFYLSMCETLCNANEDMQASFALKDFGEEDFAFLFPERDPDDIPVIPVEKYDFKPIAPPAASASPDLGDLGGEGPVDYRRVFIGSNNWAVSPKKSANGHALLCNDPHLELTLPAIWFELQLATPLGNSYGVCFPGTPGVSIGFNETGAWGFTNVGMDVKDWYRMEWTDKSRKSYELDGKTVASQIVRDTILVKGQAPLVDSIIWTQWGPVVYDVIPGHPLADYAMQWLPIVKAENELPMIFLGLNRSHSISDYSRFASYMHTPAQNVIWADTAGNIALRAQGTYLVKDKEQGRFLRDGSKGSEGWKGFVPETQVPAVTNPPSGYVASANQVSTWPAYPYYYNGVYESWRGKTINAFLRSRDSLSINDMKSFQNSTYSEYAARLLPLLVARLDTTALQPEDKQLALQLSMWPCTYDANRAEPILFEKWKDAAYRMTWDEFFSHPDSAHLLYPEEWRWVRLIREDPGNKYFDIKRTSEHETWSQVATAAFRQALASYRTELSARPGLNWGKYKNTLIRHLARLQPFSRPVENGGQRDALNAVTPTNGPSWRMIVDLGKPVKGLGVFPGGQSGNPGSRFYDNLVQTWARGEYLELKYMNHPGDPVVTPSFTLQFNP